MIRLSDKELPAKTAEYLRRFQRDVDAQPDYSSRVAEAKQLWQAKTNSARATLLSVRRTLTEAHGGDPRCAYCGYSKADEIDHIWPKSLYPELVFAWTNYLYSCGECNGFKGGKFAIFADNAATVVTSLERRAGSAIVEPVKGEPAIIDPWREDPLEFLFIDLIPEPRSRLVCQYRPKYGIGDREVARANYTIDVLGLNSRNHLPRGRESAFLTYRDGLAQYIPFKRNGATAQELGTRIAAFQGHPNRAVWEEMKRWHVEGWLKRIPELRPIDDHFSQAPEALTW